MSMYVHRIGSPIKPMTLSDVRYGSLADISERTRDVRFTPESGHAQRQHRCPLSAKSGRYRTDCRCIDHELRSSANTHAKVEDRDR